MKYEEKAFDEYSKAFLPPVRESWGYLPRWNKKLSDAYINKIHNNLVSEQMTSGQTVNGLFLLSLIYKHTNRVTNYRSCIESLLKLEPDHLEAKIALRDNIRYADPFFFPSWNQIRSGEVAFRQEILEYTKGDGLFIEQVHEGGRIFPVFIIKKSLSSFKSKIDKNTEVQILTDIVSIVPGMSALMYAIPVIFDDYGNPYWSCTYLVPHQGGLSRGGIQITHFGPSVNLPPSDISIRMCEQPGKSGLILLDENNEIKFSWEILFQDSQNLRLREMKEVIYALGERKVDFEKYREYTSIHQNSFSVTVRCTNGHEVQIPAGRDPDASNILIYSVIAKGDRLRLKTDQSGDHSARDGTIHDIFISHAHSDSNVASGLKNWMHDIWPSMDIYLTNVQFENSFEQDPVYFLRELNRSSCVIFLATKRGLARPAVQAEIGAAREVDKLFVLCGEATKEDIGDLRNREIFADIDLEKTIDLRVTDSHKHLAKYLSKTLGLTLPNQIPELNIIKFNEKQFDDPYDPSASFLSDFIKMLISANYGTKNDQENSIKSLLENIYENSDEKTKKQVLSLNLLAPSIALANIIVASGIRSEKQIVKILNQVPSLVNDEMYSNALEIYNNAETHYPDEKEGWGILCRVIKKFIY